MKSEETFCSSIYLKLSLNSSLRSKCKTVKIRTTLEEQLKLEQLKLEQLKLVQLKLEQLKEEQLKEEQLYKCD